MKMSVCLSLQLKSDLKSQIIKEQTHLRASSPEVVLIEEQVHQRAYLPSLLQLELFNTLSFCLCLCRGVSSKIVLFSWWIFLLFVISSYSANLAAGFTTNALDSNIRSLQDLFRISEMKFGYVEHNIQESNDEAQKKIFRKIRNRRFRTQSEAFENITNGNIAIVTSSFDDLGLIFNATDNNYIIANLELNMTKPSPYICIFNYNI